MTDPLDEAVEAATVRFLKLRASVALECAIGAYLAEHGRDETVKRLRADAEHIDEN